MVYRVVERVVLEHVHVVDARSPRAARCKCEKRGDGEAVEHNEVERGIVSIDLVIEDV